MNIRTVVEADLDIVLALVEDQSINTTTVDRFKEYLDSGAYRYEWTWVAERDGAIVALAVWWGMEQSDHPFSIDGLYIATEEDPVPVWSELIRQSLATFPADAGQSEYHFFLPNGWRDRPEVVAALEPRLAAAAAAGLSETTERLRYEWMPDYGLRALPRKTWRSTRRCRASGPGGDSRRTPTASWWDSRCLRQTRAAPWWGISAYWPSIAATGTATICWRRSRTYWWTVARS